MSPLSLIETLKHGRAETIAVRLAGGRWPTQDVERHHPLLTGLGG